MVQSVIFLFGRDLLGNFIGQWLHTVSNIEHIRRWDADGAIAAWRVGNQHPYS